MVLIPLIYKLHQASNPDLDTIVHHVYTQHWCCTSYFVTVIILLLLIIIIIVKTEAGTANELTRQDAHEITQSKDHFNRTTAAATLTI